MSSSGTVKSAPTSSKSSGKQGRNLAQELGEQRMKDDGEESSDDDNTGEQLGRANRDIKQLQGMFNENSRLIEELQNAVRQANQRAQAAEQRNQTLQAAANIITTPVPDGREKLKLNSPVRYGGSDGVVVDDADAGDVKSSPVDCIVELDIPGGVLIVLEPSWVLPLLADCDRQYSS